jgi:hypothetical protein
MQNSENPSPPGTQSPPENRPGAPARNPWAYPVMWMVVCLMVVAGGVYVFKSCRDLPGETLERTGKLLGQAGDKLERLAAAFKQGTVTTTFASTATALSGSQYLQVATLSQQETFTRKDESSLAYGYIPLPDVIVEARAPVTYTYYLDLNDKWELTLQEGVIYVVAPHLKYNKPAVDVSRLEWEVKKDSMFRKTGEAMENLKSSITYLAGRKAATNVELVRETGRHQTELFVENWLSKTFSDGKKYPVKVRFRGEGASRPSVGAPKQD